MTNKVSTDHSDDMQLFVRLQHTQVVLPKGAHSNSIFNYDGNKTLPNRVGLNSTIENSPLEVTIIGLSYQRSSFQPHQFIVLPNDDK